MQDRIPRYKNHRLKNYDYSSEGYYHIEFNTKFRRHHWTHTNILFIARVGTLFNQYIG